MIKRRFHLSRFFFNLSKFNHALSTAIMFTKINQSSAIFSFIFDHFFLYILDFHTTCHNKQGLNRLTNYIGLYKAERREKKRSLKPSLRERQTENH